MKTSRSLQTLSRWPAGVLALAWALAPLGAQASPWTLPRGNVVADLSYQYQFATQEFFDTGGIRNFPLRGRSDSSSFRLKARFGITDRFEIEAGLPVSVVSFSADPVLLLERPADSTLGELQYYQRNVIQLARTRAGPTDFEFAARFQWLPSPIVIASELRLKAPTGYDKPQGTFGDRPTSAADFLANVGTYVRPENVRDDVTLGDGQLDVTASLLLGVSITPQLFARLDGGYVLRFGGAGDQVTGALRAGYLITDKFLVYASGSILRTVQQGDVIGISVAAQNPDLPASEYGGANNLLLRELRLERDALTVDGGFLIRVTPEVEVNFNVGRLLWGRNTAAVTSGSVGISIRADLFAQPLNPG